MALGKRLETLARSQFPPAVARLAKTSAVYPRYLAQRRACRAGFRGYGDLYPQKVLFIAGLPKSGTTWLEKMISSYPGFHELLIPDPPRTSPAYDLAYELPSDMFSRFDRMLVLTKMHVPGTNHNAELLRAAGVHYVVMFRDLRDVAVSLYFYVRQTRWHPLYRDLDAMNLQDGLRFFADRLLEPYAEWIRSWIHNSDPDLGLVLRYEDVLREPEEHVAAVARHFELDASPERVREIVETHSFRRMSGGRESGQENARSFYRKAVAGDWRNHFTPDIGRDFKARIGDLLIELGYETDLSW